MSNKRAFTAQAVESGGYNVVGPNFYSAPVADYSTASNLADQLNYAHAVGRAAFAPTPEDIARWREAAGFAPEDVAKLKAEFFERIPAIKQWYDLLALYEKQRAFVAMSAKQNPLRTEMVHQLVQATQVDTARLLPEVRAPINKLVDAIKLLAAECEQLRATCNARVRE